MRLLYCEEKGEKMTVDEFTRIINLSGFCCCFLAEDAEESKTKAATKCWGGVVAIRVTWGSLGYILPCR